MILFGNGVVTVQPATKVENSVGGWDVSYDGATHQVTGCTVQPGVVSETDTQNRDPYVLRCRGPWPWGSKTRVIFQGSEFDQVGEAIVRQVGTFTRHVEVRLSARVGVT